MDTKQFVKGYQIEESDAPTLEDVGAGIRSCRNAAALTQSQLGDRLGIRKSQVCKIEKGENLTLGTVAEAYGAMGMRASLAVDPDLDETTLYFLVEDLFEKIESVGKEKNIEFRNAYLEMERRGEIDDFIMGWYEKI